MVFSSAFCGKNLKPSFLAKFPLVRYSILMWKHLVDFLSYLKNEKNASPHTVRSYCSDLEQLADFLGPMSCPRLTIKRSAASWPTSCSTTSQTVRCRKLSAIRTFFRYLNREGILTGNPARLVATPRAKNGFQSC